MIGINWPDEDYSGRVDWQLGQDTLTARYQYTHQMRETDDVIIGEQARQDNPQQNLGFTWTKIVQHQRVVGEFRYGLGVRDTQRRTSPTATTRRSSASPARRSSGTILGNAGTFPILRDQLDNQFVYNLSWRLAAEPLVQGRHRHPRGSNSTTSPTATRAASGTSTACAAA